jgi:hypothetical protein
MRSYVLSRKRTKSQQDSLFANLLAATLESPYLSTTKKEVKYCDHAIIIVSCVYIEFKEVVVLIAILTIVWFLNLDVAYKTKCGASGYPSKIRQ